MRILLTTLLLTLPCAGQLLSTPLLTASQCLKGAVSLDGTTDHAQCADDDSLSFGDASTDSPFTFSAWVKRVDTSEFLIIQKFWSSSQLEYGMQFNTGGVLSFALYDANWGIYEAVNSDLSFTGYDNIWTHVAVTYDGGGGSTASDGLTLYFNGLKTPSTTVDLGSYTAMHNSTAPLEIGGRTFVASYAEGMISSPRFTNGELTADEVYDLYKFGRNPPYTDAGYWKFDDWTDSSGNGNTMVAQADAVLTTDPFDLTPCRPLPERCAKGSVSLDGTGDSVDLGNNDYDGDMSAFAWVNSDTVAYTLYGDVVLANDSSSGANYDFAVDINRTAAKINVAVGGTLTESTGTLSANTWHLIGFTRSGTEIKIYIDGVLDTTNASGGTPNGSAEQTYIGRRTHPTYPGYFDGEISDCRIYDAALSQDEVYDLFKFGRPTSVDPVSHWEFNGDYTDSVGSNDGTAQGDAVISQLIEDVPPCRNPKSPPADAYLVWNFDSADSTDSSGNGRDATDTVVPIYTNGYCRFVYGDYIFYDVTETVNDWTLAYWIRLDAQEPAQFHRGAHAFTDGAGGTTTSYPVSATQMHSATYDSNDNNSLTIGSDDRTVWHHICWIKDGTTATFYRNREYVLEYTVPASFTPHVNTFQVGRSDYGNQYLDGDVDNVRLYQRAVDAPERDAIFQEKPDDF